ncbi:MAG TPA: hypothetical protein VNN73_07145 [Blastocatellia bacterium]|nr:hypothetical protein [Blastocatellia bacterium]
MKSNPIKQVSFAPRPASRIMAMLAQAITFIALVLFIQAINVRAQQGGEAASSRSQVAPRAELQQAYRAAPRDPFKREVAAKVDPKKPAGKVLPPHVVAFPSLEARRAEFQRLVKMAVETDRPEPDPISQYLVSELEVTGVFRDGRGFGAFVRAQPTGTTFFIRGGARVYNGEVLRIESDETGTARVVFREVTYIENNGKQTPQEKIVNKVPTATAAKK